MRVPAAAQVEGGRAERLWVGIDRARGARCVVASPDRKRNEPGALPISRVAEAPAGTSRAGRAAPVGSLPRGTSNAQRRHRAEE
jgi:hypothetical protein